MEEDHDPTGILIQGDTEQQTIDESTPCYVLNRLISTIFFPDPNSEYASAPLLQRIKASLSVNIPLLRDMSRNTARRVLLWTRRGGTFRALLVVSKSISVAKYSLSMTSSAVSAYSTAAWHDRNPNVSKKSD